MRNAMDKSQPLITYPSWHVTKFVILRFLSLVYLVAFLGAFYQNPGLMGLHGLQPASHVFSSLSRQYKSHWEGFQTHPSIFWWVEHSEKNIEHVHLAGISISLLVVLGVESSLFMFLLWILYFSIVTNAVGTSFYSYGWESQLLETGFLAIFICDFILPHHHFPTSRMNTQPSQIVLWLLRWLCFRISIGAGLIKIRGDSCWTEKTCLYHHFETQPIPSPMSFLFHFLPKFALKHAVDLDLFVQVYTSWMVLCPTYIPGNHRLSKIMLNVVRLGGFIQASFMVNIILSGNFAFLNHLTIIPALACLDDACWPKILHRLSSSPNSTFIKSYPTDRSLSWYYRFRLCLNLLLLGTVGYLSLPVISNLLQLDGKHQLMNASFNSFRLVNSYGAFGSVGKKRYEPIISITYNGIDWIELEFPCKPGKLTRRPCFCAPYHYRLDWNIWFIGFKPHQGMLQQREAWLFALVAKLLDYDLNDRPWLNLLDSSSSRMLETNYNVKKMTPRYAKVDMFHYKMKRSLWLILQEYWRYRGQKEVQWWDRVYEEILIPPVELGQNKQLVRAK